MPLPGLRTMTLCSVGFVLLVDKGEGPGWSPTRIISGLYAMKIGIVSRGVHLHKTVPAAAWSDLATKD